MAITEAPAPQGAPPEPPTGPKFRRKSTTRYDGMEPDELLHLIDNLEDERSRARVREGIYVSLLAHVLIFLFLLFGPKYILRRPKVVSPFDVLSERQKKEMTYLTLPPDALKNIRPKNPKALSDKNRVAQTPHPTLDRKTIEQLQAMRAPGPPAPRETPREQQPPQPQQAAPQQPAPEQPKAAPTQPLQPQLQGVEPSPPAAPKPQPTKPDFNTNMSAGEAIRQAARGAAQPQTGGDFGGGRPSQHPGLNGSVDILSDTMGVDFGPYLQRVIAATYRSWLPLIPESARPPLSKQGKVGIEFVINKDGTVQGMKLKFPSGDVSLDRAAWGGITGASPYPPLPKEFKGPYLALRFGFYYNVNDEQR